MPSDVEKWQGCGSGDDAGSNDERAWEANWAKQRIPAKSMKAAENRRILPVVAVTRGQ